MSTQEKIRVHFNLQIFNFKCGINTYETEITRRLLRYDDIDGDPFYITRTFFNKSDDDPSDIDFPLRKVHFPKFLAFRNKSMKFYLRLITYVFSIFEPFFSFDRLLGGKPDDKFVFFENDMPTLPLKSKTVAVLHDIIPLRLKAFKGISERSFRRNAQSVVDNATKIVTVSEYSKQEIVNYFNIDAGRIEVVYNAVNAENFSREKTNVDYLKKVRQKYALPDKYILHFGSCDPQKNIPNLIKAYAMLPNEIKDEYKLFITNPTEAVKKCADENGMSENVFYAYKVPNEDKPGMYQLASLFAWPSYIEGFGIPILEAQASGVPVVSSNTTSMPEVAGDSALYFAPDDVEAMSEAMRKCLTDEVLRNDLIAKGYGNIKRFSWDRSAEKFHDIIKKLS